MSVLMFELALTRIFQATMYHFAFMAISLALFGSGASGVFIYMIQRRLAPERTGEWLSLSSQLFAATTLTFSLCGSDAPCRVGSNDQNYYTLSYHLRGDHAPSFFFAGCVITLAVTRYASDISRLYLFGLAGAAIGCLLLIPVLNQIGAINTVLLVSASSAGASVLFVRRWRRDAPTPPVPA